MKAISLSQSDAELILKHALAKQGVKLESFETTLKLNAVVGLMVAVVAMQELGWRVAAPLIDVPFEE